MISNGLDDTEVRVKEKSAAAITHTHTYLGVSYTLSTLFIVLIPLINA